MPTRSIALDYQNVLADRIGPAHGIGAKELSRSDSVVKEIVRRVERERKAGGHRYRDLPTDRRMRATVLDAVRRRKKGIENLVVLGIGGSALGNIALQSALNPPLYNLLPPAKRRGPRLFVMDNIDPVQFSALLDLLGTSLRKTLFNVISKSGETAETASQFLIIRDLLRRKLGKSFARQVLVTTDPESGTLRSQADEDGYETLPVPPGVGGRFSVLSAVGLFSAAMCGIDVGRLLDGAAAMSERVATTTVKRNPAAMLALLLTEFYARGKRIHVMFPYAGQLRDLADWYRQLWAESLGKQHGSDGRPAGVGPTPVMSLGATDQHSQVQLYREGPNDKVFVFVEVEKFARDVKIPRSGAPEPLRYLQGASLATLLNAEKRATEYALVASQRPCMTLRLPEISPWTVGEFILLWEAATTIAGALLGIDPYDQPAVQLGKDYTYALMGRAGFADLRRKLEGRPGARNPYVV